MSRPATLHRTPHRPHAWLAWLAASQLAVAGLWWVAGWRWGLPALLLSHAAFIVPVFLPRATLYAPALSRLPGDERQVWLTIDDGPSDDTPAILDALDRHGMQATFFLVGQRAQARPELVREILRRGHGVANHTWSHPQAWFWALGPRAMAAQVERAQAVLGELAGQPPPPTAAAGRSLRDDAGVALVDEIYDQVLYDGAAFEPTAPIAGDHPCITFSGLSKVHRACGWRVGWAVLTGSHARTAEYRNALDLLSGLRLCANVGGQYAIEAAVNGPDTISALCAPGGRLYETRRAVVEACAASEHLRLIEPKGALYAFPSVVGAAARGFDDHQFALELLETEDVLIVPGSSFNVPYRDHFRVTLLPEAGLMREVFARIDRALSRRAELNTKVVPLKARNAAA